MAYPQPSKLSKNHKKIAKFNAVAAGTEDDAWQVRDAGTNGAYSDTALTLDNTYAVNGTDGIRLDWDHNASTNEDNPSVRISLSEPLNLSGAKTIGFLVYVEGSDESTEMGWWDFNNVITFLGSNKSTWAANYSRYYMSRGDAAAAVSYAKLGYWWVTIDLDLFVTQTAPPKNGTFTWANIETILFNLQADTATSYGTSTIHFLDVVVDPVPNRVPRVAICFDDGIDSDYTEAFAYMQTKNVMGTSFVIYDKVNNPADAGRISLAQAVEMDAAGWEIGYHFISNGGAYLDLFDATAEQRIAAHEGWQAFCTTNNLERGRRSFAYPRSEQNLVTRQELYDAGIRYARAGLNSNVNALVESNESQDPINPVGGFGLDDPLRIPAMIYNPDSADEQADENYLGQGIYHAGSGQGTHTAADSATVMTDANAIFWSTNEYQGFIIENITDGSYGFISAGTSTTQTCTLFGGSDNTWQTGDEYRMRYPDSASPRLTSQADLILKRVLETNSDAVITFHGIVASGATGIEVNRADFRNLIDKVEALNNAGVIDAVKFQDMFSEPSSGGSSNKNIISRNILSR